MMISVISDTNTNHQIDGYRRQNYELYAFARWRHFTKQFYLSAYYAPLRNLGLSMNWEGSDTSCWWMMV